MSILAPSSLNPNYGPNSGCLLWLLVSPPSRDAGSTTWDLVQDRQCTFTSLTAGEGFSYNGLASNHPSGIPGAYVFSGGASNGYLSCPAIGGLAGIAELSISAWVFIRGAGGGTFGRILDASTFTLLTNSTAGIFQISVPGGSNTTNITQAINSWHQVTAVWKSGVTASIYYDGRPLAMTNKAPSGTTGAAATVAIGNRTTGGRGHDGYIKDVRIWKRALSSAEVADIYWDSLEGYQQSLIWYDPFRQYLIPSSGAATTFRRQWTMRAGSRGAC